jgi:hypothetical protein
MLKLRMWMTSTIVTGINSNQFHMFWWLCVGTRWLWTWWNTCLNAQFYYTMLTSSSRHMKSRVHPIQSLDKKVTPSERSWHRSYCIWPPREVERPYHGSGDPSLSQTALKLCPEPLHSSWSPREVVSTPKARIGLCATQPKVRRPTQSSSTSPIHSINEEIDSWWILHVCWMTVCIKGQDEAMRPLPWIHGPIHQVSANSTMSKTYTQGKEN